MDTNCTCEICSQYFGEEVQADVYIVVSSTVTAYACVEHQYTLAKKYQMPFERIHELKGKHND